MDILGPPHTPLEVLAVLVAVRVGLPLGVRVAEAAAGLIKGAVRLVRRRRAPEPVPESLDWPADLPLSLTLLVRVDEGEGVIRPSVQIRGTGEPRRGRIRLELVDHDGAIRLVLKRAFPAEALNAELALPPFDPPGTASLQEVLGWRWDVVLSGQRSELRWQERPQPSGGLTPEAELHGEEQAPSAPLRRRFTEGTHDSHLQRPSRRAVLRARAARLVLAIALIAYIVVVYSGPAGQVSELRALLLFGAFAAVWVALWALVTALFASEADLAGGDRTRESRGRHRRFDPVEID